MLHLSTGNIFLIGPMGAGKSAIGKLYAQFSGLQFCDSDDTITQQAGVDIPTIFEYEGEQGFRQRELQAIDELTQKSRIILATGGGAILAPINRQHLQTRGLVIYLQVDLNTQMQRINNDSNRPLLQTQDPQARLQQIMRERDPLYSQTADIIFDTGQCLLKNSSQELHTAIEEALLL